MLTTSCRGRAATQPAVEPQRWADASGASVSPNSPCGEKAPGSVQGSTLHWRITIVGFINLSSSQVVY